MVGVRVSHLLFLALGTGNLLPQSSTQGTAQRARGVTHCDGHSAGCWGLFGSPPPTNLSQVPSPPLSPSTGSGPGGDLAMAGAPSNASSCRGQPAGGPRRRSPSPGAGRGDSGGDGGGDGGAHRWRRRLPREGRRGGARWIRHWRRPCRGFLPKSHGSRVSMESGRGGRCQAPLSRPCLLPVHGRGTKAMRPARPAPVARLSWDM